MQVQYAKIRFPFRYPFRFPFVLCASLESHPSVRRTILDPTILTVFCLCLLLNKSHFVICFHAPYVIVHSSFAPLHDDPQDIMSKQKELKEPRNEKQQ